MINVRNFENWRAHFSRFKRAISANSVQYRLRLEQSLDIARTMPTSCLRWGENKTRNFSQNLPKIASKKTVKLISSEMRRVFAAYKAFADCAYSDLLILYRFCLYTYLGHEIWAFQILTLDARGRGTWLLTFLHVIWDDKCTKFRKLTSSFLQI